MPSPKYSVNGKLIAQPQKGQELLGYLLEAAHEMENLPECYCYIVGMNPAEPDAVYVYEVWESEAAHDVSLQLPVFANLIQKARPIIAGMEDFPSLTIFGGKASHLG